MKNDAFLRQNKVNFVINNSEAHVPFLVKSSLVIILSSHCKDIFRNVAFSFETLQFAKVNFIINNL